MTELFRSLLPVSGTNNHVTSLLHRPTQVFWQLSEDSSLQPYSSWVLTLRSAFEVTVDIVNIMINTLWNRFQCALNITVICDICQRLARFIRFSWFNFVRRWSVFIAMSVSVFCMLMCICFFDDEQTYTYIIGHFIPTILTYLLTKFLVSKLNWTVKFVLDFNKLVTILAYFFSSANCCFAERRRRPCPAWRRVTARMMRSAVLVGWSRWDLPKQVSTCARTVICAKVSRRTCAVDESRWKKTQKFNVVDSFQRIGFIN